MAILELHSFPSLPRSVWSHETLLQEPLQHKASGTLTLNGQTYIFLTVWGCPAGTNQKLKKLFFCQFSLKMLIWVIKKQASNKSV